MTGIYISNQTHSPFQSSVPPNVILARGCPHRQNCVLHAWGFAWLRFRLILLSAFVVFAFVEEGKGSLVVCIQTNSKSILPHADCIQPEKEDSRQEMKDLKGFKPQNGKDTLSAGIVPAVGRPVTWANMRDICEEIDQMSRRYDTISLSSPLCNKFLQAMELPYQPYPCECTDHIWKMCGAVPAQSKTCYYGMSLWSTKASKVREGSRANFLRLLLAQAGVQGRY